MATIFFAEFKVAPVPGDKRTAEYGGAIVTCWMGCRDADSAAAIARVMLEDEGWAFQTMKRLRPVCRDDLNARDQKRYDDAAVDGLSFILFTWPPTTGESR